MLTEMPLKSCPCRNEPCSLMPLVRKNPNPVPTLLFTLSSGLFQVPLGSLPRKSFKSLLQKNIPLQRLLLTVVVRVPIKNLAQQPRCCGSRLSARNSLQIKTTNQTNGFFFCFVQDFRFCFGLIDQKHMLQELVLNTPSSLPL